MPEVLQIALKNFLRLGMALAAVYGVYRMLKCIFSLLPDWLLTRSSDDTLDEAGIFFRVTTGIFGFLLLALCVFVTICGTAMAVSRHSYLGGEFKGLLVLSGIVGIFSCVVFGIYQEYPPTRWKIIGLLAIFSAMVGTGLS